MEKGNENANKQKNTPYPAVEAEYGVFFVDQSRLTDAHFVLFG